MSLISGELLLRVFLTKSLISPSFTGESSNFSSRGCGRLRSLGRPSGVSVSGSVYLFPKVCFQVLFRYIKDPVFLFLEQFFGVFRQIFFEIAPSFSFL